MANISSLTISKLINKNNDEYNYYYINLCNNMFSCSGYYIYEPKYKI